MAEMSWAYAAGFIDGEGSFTIGCHHEIYFNCRCSISQARPEVLRKLQVFFASNDIKAALYKECHAPRGNIWYNLRISDRTSLRRLCVGLRPYLVVKQQQAILAYNFCSIIAKRCDGQRAKDKYEERMSLREELMSLNKVRKVG